MRRTRFAIGGLSAAALLMFAGELLVRYAVPSNDPALQLHFVAGPGRFPTRGPIDQTVWNVSTADGWQTRVHFDRFGLRQAGDITRADASAIYVVGDYFPFGWGVEDNERFADLLAVRLGIAVHDIAILGNLPQGDLKLVHYVESSGAAVRRLMIVLPMEQVVQQYAESPSVALPESEGDMPSAARLELAHVSLAQYRAIATMWRVPYDSLPGVGGASPEPLNSTSLNIRLWLKDHSALYRFALRAVHTSSKVQIAATRLGLSEKRRPIQGNTEDDKATRITVNLLAQIAEHYDVFLVVLPSPAAWIGDGTEQERRRHAAFVAALTKRGLKCLDLLPVFDAAGGLDVLAYSRELYWNALAHKVTADALALEVAAHWHIGSY